MKISAVVQNNSGLLVAQFDTNELLEHIDDVKLAFVPLDIDSLIRETAERRLERVTISPNGVAYPVYHVRTIDIHDPPKPSGSPKSDARYYVWDDNTGLLLQLIPPNSRTSCNYHETTNEGFYNLVGQCRICTCSYKDMSYKDEKSLNGTSLHITPYTCHQLSTSSNPAINMILMKPYGLGMTDHHYPERCVRGLW